MVSCHSIPSTILKMKAKLSPLSQANRIGCSILTHKSRTSPCHELIALHWYPKMLSQN